MVDSTGEKNSVRVACIQVNSRDDVLQNLARIEYFLEQASQKQVELVLLPENFAQMPAASDRRHTETWQPFGADQTAPVQHFIQAAATRHGLTIVAGSLPVIDATSERTSKSVKPFARCFVVAPELGLLAQYDKLHLFDVDTGEARYCESDDFEAGSLQQVSDLPPRNLVSLDHQSRDLTLGLSICYDLRFPELYRDMLNHGAQVFTMPAAFTYETGKRHWQVLLQARAIENQSFVMAAGQCGAQTSTNGTVRRTWGHSMIIAPTGEIIASLEHEEGLLIADIDLIHQSSVRRNFPVLDHQRVRT